MISEGTGVYHITTAATDTKYTIVVKECASAGTGGSGTGGTGQTGVEQEQGTHNENAAGRSQEMVTLCHQGRKTITVIAATVREAHLAHGDSLGRCERVSVVNKVNQRRLLPETGSTAILGLAVGLLLISGATIGLLVVRKQ